MSIFKKNKKSDLYLSDKPPLTPLGKIGLGLSYIVLIFWTGIILWPLSKLVISSFNGEQGKYLILNGGTNISKN